MNWLSKEEEKKNIFLKDKFWFVIAIVFGVTGLLSPFIPKYILNIHQYPELGNLGDWWGGTSAMFIAIAGIILLVLNYLSQKNELELTRNEFKTQNQTLKIQRFENTFFHLVSLYNKIVALLYYSSEEIQSIMKKNLMINDTAVSGREFFSEAYHWLKSRMYDTPKESYNNEYEAVKDIYNHFFRRNKKYFEHYFNTISEILKYVANSPDINEIQKKFYMGIFKAQLSNYELIFLFYHGISNYSDGIKEILEDFKFLKNIDEGLIFKIEHLKFYNQFTEN
jgi:hypothetical protein